MTAQDTLIDASTEPLRESESAATDPALVSQSPKTESRVEFIDFARALCALWVLVGHVFSIRYGDQIPDNLFMIQWLSANVFFAVTTFIALSGFSLFISIAKNQGKMRESIPRYFALRALRIIPPYYFALAIGVPIEFIYTKVPHAMLRREAWDHIWLIQDHTMLVNYILPQTWSIAVEWHIYFILPILVIAFLRYGIARTAIGATLIAYAADKFIGPSTMHFAYYAIFTLGAASALISYSDQAWVKLYKSWPWAILSVAAFAAFELGLGPIDQDFTWALGVCAALVAVAINTKPVVYPKPIVWIGSWSYSLYLIHWPILIFLLAHYGKSLKFLLLGLIVSLVAAYVFYLLFELPFLNMRKYLRPKKVVPVR